MAAAAPAYLQDGYQSAAELGNMLDQQLRLVWPLELVYLERYGIGAGTKCLDVACGQGAWARRLAEHFDGAIVHAVDLEERNVEVARQRHCGSAAAANGSELTFEVANAYHLSAAVGAGSFDFAACRSVLYTVPQPEKIVAEVLRSLKPDGGVAHFFCEDYGMVFCHPSKLDQETWWREGPCTFLRSQDCNGHMGRCIYSIASRAARTLGLSAHVSVASVPITTSPADAADEPEARATLGAIFETWKDYAPHIATQTRYSEEEALAHFDDLVKACADPEAWVSWQCTVCTVKLAGVVSS